MYVLADSQMYLALDNTKQKKLTASCQSYIAVALSRCWRRRGNRCFLCAQNRDKINELPSRQRHIIRVTELKSLEEKEISCAEIVLGGRSQWHTNDSEEAWDEDTDQFRGRHNCSVTVAMPIFFLY